MERLVPSKGHNSIIDRLTMDADYYKKFKDRMFNSLKKFGTSRKTKAVHMLIDKDTIQIGTFGGQQAEVLGASHYSTSGNKLSAVILNLFMYNDSMDQRGAVKIFGEIRIIDDKINKEKTYLTDKQILNIEKLNEEKNKLMDELLDTLDYIKVVDGIYFEYLRFLTLVSLSNNQTARPKILTLVSDLFSLIIKKLYNKVNKEIETETHQLIEAASIYFILIFYFGNTGSYALNRIKDAYKEEVIESIHNARVTKFTKFTDLAKLLSELNLLNITDTSFDNQIKLIFGNYANQHYIQDNLTDFIAVNANMTQNTQLFNAFKIDDDIHERLEQLVLNEKKKITIQKK